MTENPDNERVSYLEKELLNLDHENKRLREMA